MTIFAMRHVPLWDVVVDPVERRILGFRCVAEFSDGSPCREIRWADRHGEMIFEAGEEHRRLAVVRMQVPVDAT